MTPTQTEQAKRLAGASLEMGTLRSEADRRRDVLDEQVNSPSWFNVFDEESVPGSVAQSVFGGTVNFLGSLGYKADPEFQITKELLDRYAPDADEGVLDVLGDAVSQEHFFRLLEDARSLRRARKTAAEELGYANFPVQLIASIFSPDNIAISAMSMGVAAPFIAAGKAGRLAIATRTGLVAAGTNVATMPIQTYGDPDVGPWDYFIAAGAGFALGTGFTYFGKQAREAGQRLMREAQLREIQEAGGTLTPKGQTVMRDVIDLPHEQKAITALDEAYGRVTADEADKLARSFDIVVNPAGRLLDDAPQVEIDQKIAQAIREYAASGDEPVFFLRYSDAFEIPAETISRIARTPADKLRGMSERGPGKITVSPDRKSLAARIERDGTLNLGGKFLAANAEDRRSMIAWAELRLRAIGRMADTGLVGPKAVQDIQEHFRIKAYGDAEKLVNDIVATVYESVNPRMAEILPRGKSSPVTFEKRNITGDLEVGEILEVRKGLNVTVGGIEGDMVRIIGRNTNMLISKESAEGMRTRTALTNKPKADAASPPGERVAIPEADLNAPRPIQGMGAASPDTIVATGAGQFERRIDPTKREAFDFNLDAIDTNTPGTRSDGIFAVMRRIPGLKGLAVSLGDSPSTTVRMFGKAAVSDPIMRKIDGEDIPVNFAGTEWVHARARMMQTKFVGEYDRAFKDWLKESGAGYMGLVNPMRKRALRSQFNTLVRDAMVQPGTPKGAIGKAVAAARGIRDDSVLVSQRHGGPGMANVLPSETYVPIAYNRTRMEAAGIKEDSWVGAFGRAVYKANQDIGLTETESRRIAAQFYNNLKQIPYGNTKSEAIMLDGPDVDLLYSGKRTLFKERVETLRASGMDDAKIDAELDKILTIVLPDSSKSKIDVAKKRLRMDLDVEDTFDTVDGKQIKGRIRDFTVEDVDALMLHYNANALGDAAEGAVLDMFERAMNRRFKKFSEVRERMDIEMREAGVPDKVAKATLERVDAAYNAMRGKPIGEGKFADELAAVRTFNYLRLGNYFGVNQLMEAGTVLSTGGLTTAQRIMPALRNLIARSSEGAKLNREYVAELKALGIGQSRMMNYLAHEPGDIGGHLNRPSRLRTISRNLRNRYADMTGMSFANDYTELAAAKIITQRFYEAAMKGKMLSKKRLGDLGMTPEQAKQVMANMVKHATPDPDFKYAVGKMNIEKWDKDVATMMNVAIHKRVNNMMNKPDIGQMSLWMTTDVGRFLTQFRTFPIVAATNISAHALAMRDKEAAIRFVAMTVMGALGYLAIQNMRTIGDPDRDRKLREAFTTDKIALAAFNRSGYSTVLPMIVDGAARYTGFGQVFSHSRTTGLASDPLFGNPTFALAEDIPRATKASHALFTRDRFSRTDLSAVARVVPFAGMIPIAQGLNALGSNLPREMP